MTYDVICKFDLMYEVSSRLVYDGGSTTKASFIQ